MNLHEEYKQSIYDWTVVRDCVKGESAVKRKSTMYLPMPSGMENNRLAVSTVNSVSNRLDKKTRSLDLFNPNLHPNPAYQAYLHRAHLPGMTSHTLRGLLGIATRKHPSVVLPSNLKYLMDDCTEHGWSLLTLFRELVSEVLQTGRVGVYLEVKDNKFKFLRYAAEDIQNWTEGRTLEAVLLREFDKPSIFDDEYKETHFLVRYGDDNHVVIDKYVDDELDSTTTPMYMGKTFEQLPFRIVGSVNNEVNVDPSPLLPVALTALQIYMKNADLSQAEYLTSNPTLIVSGISVDEMPQSLGSTVALCMNDPLAKAYYTETDSAGMQHLLSHIKELSSEAAQHGASLIASHKGDRESGAALRIRQTASTATLHSVVNAVGDAVESLLIQAAEMAGEDSSKITFEPNVEFAEAGLDAAQLKSVTESYLNNTISLETLLDNFRKAGLLQSGDSTKDELKRIKESQTETPSGVKIEPVEASTVYESADKVKAQDVDGRKYSGKD